ncbi:hypothetical protein V2A60_001657 [Cordyceps javanica]
MRISHILLGLASTAATASALAVDYNVLTRGAMGGSINSVGYKPETDSADAAKVLGSNE